MTIRNVIFDLDGTLVDSRSGIEYSVRAALRAVIPYRSYPVLRLRIGIPIRQIFSEILGDPAPLLLDRLERQFRVSYDSTGWKQSRPYQGAKKTLNALTRLGINCFLATNKPRHITLRILDHLGLDDFFCAVVTPDTFDPPLSSKTDVVTHIMRTYQLNSAETLYVGDTGEDRCAADACGIAFAAATYGYGDFLPGPEGRVRYAMISGLTEVADVIATNDKVNHEVRMGNSLTHV